MELVEGLRTTGAVREFLPDAVPDRVVHRLLDTARFAPNGGNAQAWRVVVVRDPEVRATLRDLYLRGWHLYLAQVMAGLRPWAPITDRAAEERAVAEARAATERPDLGDFAEHLDEVPVLLVVLVDLRKLAAVDRDLDRYSFVGGASVYPFAWSVLLAARAEGLGGVLTTMHVHCEDEVKELLGVPEEFALAGVLALGHPVRQPTRLRREPVASFATLDTFDGSALEP
ncbi:MAG: nitroreductase family protein [Acidimicrobiales bacterium]|jgi:nitroreductase|nr:nitroreductase family protein [Acidimicrobiales bacterium]